MGNYDDPELTGRSTRARWPVALTAVLALLIAGAAGYAVRALTTEPPAPVVVVAAPPVPVPANPGPTSTSGCTAAAEASAALVEQLQLAARAIQNLDPSALRVVLDRVQQLQGELEVAVRACAGGVSAAPPPAVPVR